MTQMVSTRLVSLGLAGALALGGCNPQEKVDVAVTQSPDGRVEFSWEAGEMDTLTVSLLEDIQDEGGSVVWDIACTACLPSPVIYGEPPAEAEETVSSEALISGKPYKVTASGEDGFVFGNGLFTAN